MVRPLTICTGKLIMTRLLRFVCTEIPHECMKTECEPSFSKSEPVHEAEDQSEPFADYETSERVDLSDELDNLHPDGINLAQPIRYESFRAHEASHGLNRRVAKGEIPNNWALLGAKNPGCVFCTSACTCKDPH